MARVPGRAAQGGEANTAGGRRDPISLDIGYQAQKGLLKNPDPTRHYVWVPARGAAAGSHGRNYYLSIGYRVERPIEGGVSTVMKFYGDDSDVIPGPYDTILMSIDKEEKAAVDEARQQRVNLLERKIIKSRTGLADVGSVRGVGDYIHFYNETSDLT